ncbi:HAD family hydrolase [Nocardiopsis dassonvillei]|uniref:HAD family hydrolase n=1 Tax=Nocardiopsis dassonvillei TaxID=2014 RepID=UPI001EE1B7C8|nr:haloacid dehalogenase-like hydrolase [Nocardiopsis dassonvillei]
MPPSTTPLILWDIDHTLLTISGVSRDIYAHAFERVTGEPPREIASMAGRTERAIITDTLTLNDREADETTIAAFYRALGDAALVLRERMRSQGRALPGGREAIALLHRAGADAVLDDLGDGPGLVALVERLTSTTGVKEGS